MRTFLTLQKNLDALVLMLLFYFTAKLTMGHIAHWRKQFKSINTYDYIIMLIKRRKKNY